MTFSIPAILGAAWERFEERGWYFIGLTIAVIGIALMVLGNAVATALYAIVITGYFNVLLRHLRKEPFVFDDLFMVDSRWVYYAFGTVIKGTLIAIGLMFFIVPGVYFMVRFMFSDLYIIDKGMRPIEALVASSELTEGYRWKLFLYMLVGVLVIICGLLCVGVGVFVAIPVLNFSYVLLFWKLQELQYLKAQQ